VGVTLQVTASTARSTANARTLGVHQWFPDPLWGRGGAGCELAL